MLLKFTNYLEFFYKEKEGIFLYNKINGSIVFIEQSKFLHKSGYLYYVGQDVSDIAFLTEHDFFLRDEEVRRLIIKSIQEINTISYTLSLTNCCNLKCDYCYQSWKNKPIRMSKEVVNNFIIKLLIDLNTYPKVDNVVINFFGGEPLLEKEIIYYTLEKLDRIALDYNKNFYYEIDTNGIFLNREFIKKFTNLSISVTLSLPADHNLHRGDGSGRDFFSLLIQNFMEIKDVFDDDNFNLSIRYNINHENINYFDEFVKFIKKLNIKCNIDAQNTDNYENTIFKNKISRSEFLKWKASDYIDILLKYGFDISELPFVSLDRHCSVAHEASCKIWADGSLGICDFEDFENRRFINSYKEITPSYLYEILNKKNFDLPEMCLNCYDYPYCGGKKICFDCSGVYDQKEFQRLRIKRYLIRNNYL